MASDGLERIPDAMDNMGEAIFVPSHLTKALVATGIAAAATGVALLSGGYALFQYRQVTLDEVKAMVTGGGKIE
jgi:hypothetical protein